MRCPKCGSLESRVVDSRLGRGDRSIRRRRECGTCSHRFTTLEEVLREGLMVRKRDGRMEDFDRTKLLGGIIKACEKRPVDIDQMNMMVSDIVIALEQEHADAIPSRSIGDKVMEHLRKLDQIAYVRYASVYKEFRDISELAAEINSLNPPASPA